MVLSIYHVIPHDTHVCLGLSDSSHRTILPTLIGTASSSNLHKTKTCRPSSDPICTSSEQASHKPIELRSSTFLPAFSLRVARSLWLDHHIHRHGGMISSARVIDNPRLLVRRKNLMDPIAVSHAIAFLVVRTRSASPLAPQPAPPLARAIDAEISHRPGRLLGVL